MPWEDRSTYMRELRRGERFAGWVIVALVLLFTVLTTAPVIWLLSSGGPHVLVD